jgi:hypothetical protein
MQAEIVIKLSTMEDHWWNWLSTRIT